MSKGRTSHGVAALLLPAMLATSGCATPPAPRTLDIAAQATALASRRLDDPVVLALQQRAGLTHDAGAAWSPDRVTVAALVFDPTLAAARTAAARGSADAALAAERANPVLSLTPEHIYHAAQTGEVSPWTITFSLAFQLLHPGEGDARRRIADAGTRANALDVADAVWKSRSRALAAMRGALLSERAEALAAQAAAAAAAWLQSTQRRIAAGEADRSEWLLVQDASTRAAAALRAREVAAVDARHALAAAIGVPATALDEVSLAWPSLEQPPLPDTLDDRTLSATAATDRVDLAALLARYEIAEAGVDQARGTRVPQVGLSPGYIYDRGDRKFSFGIDAELPLFHGADARIASALAARDDAVAQVRARQAEIIAALDRGHAAYAARYRAWQALREASAAAAAAEHQADTALRLGSGDRPALLQASARHAEADLAALDGLAATLDALAAIEDALQHPLWPTSVFGDRARLELMHADGAH